MKLAWVAAGLLGSIFFASPAGAQSAPNQEKEVLSNGNLGHTLRAAPVLGQPFSATEVHQLIRTLADGTKIRHRGHHFVARDSQGRVRVETRFARGANGQPDSVMVFVKDPVANTLTIWATGPMAHKKIAFVTKIPAASNSAPARQPPPKPATSSNRPQPTITTENLGTDTFQGVPVTMVRITKIVPAGRVGNDAPITVTYETWTSPDLKLLMKQQLDDPRSGETIGELDNLSQTEPDPALFHPPAGYKVKTVQEALQDLEKKLSQTQN